MKTAGAPAFESDRLENWKVKGLNHAALRGRVARYSLTMQKTSLLGVS